MDVGRFSDGPCVVGGHRDEGEHGGTDWDREEASEEAGGESEHRHGDVRARRRRGHKRGRACALRQDALRRAEATPGQPQLLLAGTS